VAARDDVQNLSSAFNPYFFLSFAHSPMIAEYSDGDPDRWVRTFFRDLVVAVRRHASPPSARIHGFIDQQVPPGSDKEALSRALATAQVFVPLYSAGYLGRSLPGREWACFRDRVKRVGLAEPVRRFVPVLWAPLSGLSGTEDPPGLREALARDADKRGYAEEGLVGLLKINSYRPSYQAVVNSLAQRIVVLAENSPIDPIEPSEVSDIDQIPSAFTPGPPLAVFTIEIAAPTGRTVAAGRNPASYGQSSAEWRPFPAQRFPLADYARQVVERFDFKAEVSGILAVEDQRTRRPGIILIDPWFVAEENGRSALASAVQNLPRWVLPLVILDQPGDPRTQELAAEVREILGAARALLTNSAREGAQGVSSPEDFSTIMRVLVTEAEVQYIRYRSGRIPPLASSDRPGLRRRHPGGTVSAPDSLGEGPDAQ
jgi:FxsC-like protein